jgi:hypothetical protein
VNIFRAMIALYLLGVMSFGGGMTWYTNGFASTSFSPSTPRSMFFTMSSDATDVLTAATEKRSIVQLALSESAKRCLSKIQGSEVPYVVMETVSSIYRKIPEMPAIKNRNVPSARDLDGYISQVSSIQAARLISRMRDMGEFSRLKIAAHLSDLASNSSEHAECTYATAYAQLSKNGVIQSN